MFRASRHLYVDRKCPHLLREAGPEDATVVLLLHGYPLFLVSVPHFMPALADRWRLIAPDYPGFGYSDMPDPSHFAYTFDGCADLLERFTAMMKLMRYAPVFARLQCLSRPSAGYKNLNGLLLSLNCRGPDAVAGPMGNCDWSHAGSRRESRMVSEIPGISAGASPSHAIV
jgi:hypothetical protein